MKLGLGADADGGKWKEKMWGGDGERSREEDNSDLTE